MTDDTKALQSLSHAWKSGYAQAKEEDDMDRRFCPHCNPCDHNGNEKCRAKNDDTKALVAQIDSLFYQGDREAINQVVLATIERLERELAATKAELEKAKASHMPFPEIDWTL